MRALVRFLLVFICMKLIVSKPQHLQQQAQFHLDPLNEHEFEYPLKDLGKRTIGPSRHYAFGKHVGIHPNGFKYVLGYSPINVKYVPVIKPITVLKPVLQQSIRPAWKPVVAPIRQYLPPILHVPKPFHQIDHGWKPVAPIVAPPVHHHKPWVDEVPHIHPVVEEPIVKPLPVPVQPVQPLIPAVPLKHPLENYFFFQTPIAKPALLPQVPLFHVARPQLPVLPLGASFPAPILQSTGPGVVHVPSASAALPFPFPVQPQPVAPIVPAHYPIPVHPPPVHHPIAVHPKPIHHPVPVLPQPVHHPVPVFPQPVPVHPHPVPVNPQLAHPFPIHPQPAALPPISIEFHGNPHLVPFNNQFPLTAVQSSVPFALPVPKYPAQSPPPVLLGRQPHALPLPPEVHTNLIPEIQHSGGQPHQVHSVHHQPPLYQSPHVPSIHNQPPDVSVQQFQPAQAPFNPEAAIQPGQTDLQVPLHLPDHPHFRQFHGVNHFQPVGNLEPSFPPFQNPGNILRPSISLEPPLTHGHSS